MASCTWALGVSTYAVISRTQPAFQIACMRALLSLPLFFLILIWQSGGFSGAFAAFHAAPPDAIAWLAVSIIASYALGDVLFLWSTRSLGISGALAIASTYPLWTALADYSAKGGGMNIFGILGLICVVAGTVGVILCTQVAPRSDGEDTGRRSLLKRKDIGLCLAVFASGMWALNAYALNRGGVPMSAALGNCFRMFFVLLLAPLVGRLIGDRGSIFLPLKFTKKYFWVFFIEGFGGTFFFLYGMSHAPLAIGAALSSLAPVLVVPVALVMRTERFSLRKALFISLVVAGVCLLLVRSSY